MEVNEWEVKDQLHRLNRIVAFLGFDSKNFGRDIITKREPNTHRYVKHPRDIYKKLDEEGYGSGLLFTIPENIEDNTRRINWDDKMIEIIQPGITNKFDCVNIAAANPRAIKPECAKFYESLSEEERKKYIIGGGRKKRRKKKKKSRRRKMRKSRKKRKRTRRRKRHR
jgi:hypothetical protein